MDSAHLEQLYQKYGKQKVDSAYQYLSYKHVDPLPKQESDKLPTIYVFRHGQSQDNADFVFSGWRDSELTNKGREQAQILAERLKNKKLQMLISSPQKRALETIQIAMSLNPYAKNLEIHTDDRIKERSYGDLQGKNKLECYLENPSGTQEIRRGYKIVPPNGESLEMVCDRVAKFCDEMIPLIKQNQINVAVSCHGNSIRGFRKYFEGLDGETVAKIETPLGQDYAAYAIR